MLVLLLVLFLLIVLLLDVLVTNPIADWLGLSLSSEREQQIEKEIVSAKDTDLLAALASLAVIGIMVPIAEEILFRGVIQTYLVRRVGAVAGIVLNGFWFALCTLTWRCLRRCLSSGFCWALSGTATSRSGELCCCTR